MSADGIDGFKGALFTPDHAGYEEARTLFNSMIDRRPAHIVQCADAEDVVSAHSARAEDMIVPSPSQQIVISLGRRRRPERG